MNVQGVNLLSLLSGSENAGNLQQGLFGLGDGQTGFASAFLEQLGLLQEGAEADMTQSGLSTIQDFMASAKGDQPQLDLQSFAALFGKDLPSVNKTAQDIDLEDTLQTLAGVLQQLQQLETPNAAEFVGPVVDSQGLAIPEKLQTLDAESAEIDAAAIGNVIGMPINAAPVEQTEASEPNADDNDLELVLTNAPAKTIPLKADVVATDTPVKLDEIGADFNRSISAMLARQGGDGKPQDKPNLNLKAESLLGGLDSQADAEVGKNLPGVAADIAKLNQAVRLQAAPAASQPAMTKHFADPAWNNELGEKLIWMHKQAIPSVELRLNPEHLGPVLVKIDVSQDQASVAFTAHNPAVKDAIEAAIPKLREMFGGQQLNLVDVNVSQQQSDQRQQPREFFQMASQQGRDNRSDLDMNDGQVNEAQNLVDEIEAGRAVATNGLLSLFA